VRHGEMKIKIKIKIKIHTKTYKTFKSNTKRINTNKNLCKTYTIEKQIKTYNKKVCKNILIHIKHIQKLYKNI